MTIYNNFLELVTAYQYIIPQDLSTLNPEYYSDQDDAEFMIDDVCDYLKEILWKDGFTINKYGAQGYVVSTVKLHDILIVNPLPSNSTYTIRR
jgi:hypothetical protein